MFNIREVIRRNRLKRFEEEKMEDENWAERVMELEAPGRRRVGTRKTCWR